MSVKKEHLKSFLLICLCVLLVVGLLTYFLYFKDLGFWQLNDAIKKQDVTEVKRLLESGVDPNGYDVVYSPVWIFLQAGPSLPIMEACSLENVEIVELLIQYGAFLGYDDRVGRSPWQNAMWVYNPTDVEMLKLLNEHGEMWYGEEGHPAFLVADWGARIAIRDKKGKIIDYEISMEKVETSIECLKILTDNTSLDMVGNCDRTLLMCGVISNNPYLVNYFISNGCDVSLKDYNGKTALDYAIEAGNEEIIALLER